MIPPSSRLLSTSSVGCCRVNFHLDSIYIFLPLVLVYVKTSLSVVVLKGIGMHYFSPLQKYSNFSFVIPPHREQERTLFVFVFIVIIKVLTTTISYPNCFLSRDLRLGVTYQHSCIFMGSKSTLLFTAVNFLFRVLLLFFFVLSSVCLMLNKSIISSP